MKVTCFIQVPLVLACLTLGSAPLTQAAEEERDKPVVSSRKEVRRERAPKGDAEARRGAMLEPAQRERLRAAFQEQRERIQDIEQKINELQRSAVRLALSSDANKGKAEEKFRRLADEIGDLQREELLLRAKALSKLGAKLSPDQRERLRDRVEGYLSRRSQSGLGSALRPFARAERNPGLDRPEKEEPRGVEKRRDDPKRREKGESEKKRDQDRAPERER